MKKKPNTKNFKLKPIIMALALMATSSAFVFTACEEEETPPSNNSSTSSKVDEQTIKNGNFEYYAENESDDGGVYYIKNVNSWSQSNDATPASDVKSGVIGTSEEDWDGFTDTQLIPTLDSNNELKADDDNYEDLYIDFNGLKSSDLPFVDTEKALADEATDADKEYIANPGTPYTVTTEGGKYYITENGVKTEVYLNEEDGEYYRNVEDGKYSNIVGSHVLMLHNYTYSHKNGSDAVIHNGTAQSYKSSSTISLAANTAAEISVWVKTDNLIFNNGEEVKQNRGAYIKVSHTVGGTELDAAYIKNINTEKLIEEGVENSNGWIKYTMYVNACDFATTTVTVTLGLGEAGAQNYVEGYAFFDDLTLTQFSTLEDEECTYDASKVTNTTCSILSEADEKIFKADSLYNNGTLVDERASKYTNYLLDLTAQNSRVDVNATSASFEMGLTVDANDFRAPATAPTPIGATAKSVEDTFTTKDFTIGTSLDKLAVLTVDGNVATIKNALNSAEYGDKIAEALNTAAELPGVSTSTDAIVMLSTEGAAYTTTVNSANLFTVAKESYQIVSFWVKTSDMDGNIAATLNISDVNDEDNVSSFTIDTSNISFDLNDEEDIYNGWVQCFFFVNNDTEEEQTYKIDFSFGNTILKGVSVASYKYGYAMIANMQTVEVDEKEFNLVGSNSYAATLTFSESKNASGNVFDNVNNGLYNQIDTTVAPPSSYNSYYGGGNYVGVDEGQYTTGLVNKESFIETIYPEYLNDSNNEKYAWLDTLMNKSAIDASLRAEEVWVSLFGSSSVQPLVITNTVRTFVGEFEAINYGYVSESQTIASSGYKAISVRVKVSEGAVAYVYLTEDNQTMEFDVPEYSFWYDEDGNVLKTEPTEENYDAIANIAYKTSPNGLYVDDEGNYFANLYNYSKFYTDQSVSYYDANGNFVLVDDILNKQVDEIYYTDANATTKAPHFLVATDGTRLFKYVDGEYKYMEDGEATVTVNNFDVSYATPRYPDGANEQYVAIIDGNDPRVAGKWITVNFYIHAGNSNKEYKVELWNGDRNVTGLNAGDVASKEGSYIIFDYAYSNLSSSNFTTIQSAYEDKIIEYYKEALVNKGVTIASNEENIEYFENLATANNIELLDNYSYHYYTFSLYDSAAYIPYNEDTAGEGETDYDYNVKDYSETLAYLSYKDFESEDANYTVFADYSAIDQSVSRIIVDSDEEDEETEVEEEVDPDALNPWLLAISIALVAAIFIAVIGYFARVLLKKFRPGKKSVDQKYDSGKKKHYMKKLKLEETVYEEDENSDKE